MKARLIGHITYDEISVDNDRYSSLGGPPVYSGLLLSKLGINPYVETRIGPDFEDSKILWLSRNGLQLNENAYSEKNTTRFSIQINRKSRDRKMSIICRCDDIILSEYQSDICLVQPVMNEFDTDEIEKVRKSCSFLLLDPQGFLRASINGRIRYSKNTRLVSSLKHVDAIKVDLDEGRIITGSDDYLGIGKMLMRLGVKEAIVTLGPSGTALFTKDSVYRVDMPRIKFYDGIGAGDMLGASYAYSRQSMSHSEALAFAVSSAISGLSRKALDKIPSRKEIEETMEKMSKGITRIS